MDANERKRKTGSSSGLAQSSNSQVYEFFYISAYWTHVFQAIFYIIVDNGALEGHACCVVHL